MNCPPSQAVEQFLSSLPPSVKALIKFRTLQIQNRATSLYDALLQALGPHNAELLFQMLRGWLKNRGHEVGLEELKRCVKAEALVKLGVVAGPGFEPGTSGSRRGLPPPYEPRGLPGWPTPLKRILKAGF